jgi:hypothetical protein
MANNHVFFQSDQFIALGVTDADVSTLVVSWNEAAEIQLFVCSDARVIPCNTCRPVAGWASRASTSFLSRRLSNEFSSRSLRALNIWPGYNWWNHRRQQPLSYQKSSRSLHGNRFYWPIRLRGTLVSPGSSTSTLRIIWRTITSKCLSLILHPAGGKLPELHSQCTPEPSSVL